MPPELRPVVKAMSLQRVKHPAYSHAGSMGDVEIVATTTGIGTGLAERTAERIFDSGAIDHALIVGVAGGLQAVGIGDVVVPEVVIDVDTEAEYHPTPFGDADIAGKLYTSGDFITDQATLGRFARDGRAAIDMETSAIAHVADRRGIPWSVFRGISDDAFDPAVDEQILGLTIADGSANLAAVARFIGSKPSRIALLRRLARDMKAASGNAAAAAARACASHEF